MSKILSCSSNCILYITRGTKTSSKKTPVRVIKKFRRESKDLFGELLESSTVRKAKLKKAEKIGKETLEDNLPTYRDETIDWIRKKTCSTSQIKILKENVYPSHTRKVIQSSNVKTIDPTNLDDDPLRLVEFISPPNNSIKVLGLSGNNKIEGNIQHLDKAYNNDTLLNIKEIHPVRKKKSSSKPEEISSRIEAVSAKFESLSKSQEKLEKAEKRKVVKSASILPDTVVKNLTSFPLLNVEKKRVLKTSAVSSEQLKLYPSVSKVLSSTMSDGSRAALKWWRTKLIAQLGEEGFLQFYREPHSSSLETSPNPCLSMQRPHPLRSFPLTPIQSKNLHTNPSGYVPQSVNSYIAGVKHTSVGQLQRGVQFHSLVQCHLTGAPIPTMLSPEVEGCWTSLSHILPDITDVKELERPVVHSQLLYRGVLDCVASYKGEPVIIEWKKSDKQKPTLRDTYDAPVQLSAYLGAMNFDSSINLEVTKGLVVVAYSDGSPGEAFSLSLQECGVHWNAWLIRLQQYWVMQQEA